VKEIGLLNMVNFERYRMGIASTNEFDENNKEGHLNRKLIKNNMGNIYHRS
jgi:hypothetical protein